MPLSAPVLLMLYNRPEPSKIVLDAIRKERPKILFVAADGPSNKKANDQERCAKTRDLIKSVDWDCQVMTLFHDKNLGCRQAVSSAISWFFEHVDCGIILEDDCLPSRSFFKFSQELLERYKNDPNILAISGNNFQKGRKVSNYSYYFSRYPHCWGWATWSRAWKLYEADMSGWSEYRQSGSFQAIGDFRSKFQQYWTSIYDRVFAGKIDSWAYVWTYSCWKNSGLTILPEKNLVKNIGFGEDATHTTVKDARIEAMQAEELDFPLRHPLEVRRHISADIFTDTHHFGIQSENPSFLTVFVFRAKKVLLMPVNFAKKTLKRLRIA